MVDGSLLQHTGQKKMSGGKLGLRLNREFDPGERQREKEHLAQEEIIGFLQCLCCMQKCGTSEAEMRLFLSLCISLKRSKSGDANLFFIYICDAEFMYPIKIRVHVFPKIMVIFIDVAFLCMSLSMCVSFLCNYSAKLRPPSHGSCASAGGKESVLITK